MANLLDIRNITTITKAEASIAEYGVDYSGGDTSILVKFDVVLDANGLIDYGIGATQILGYQFDLDIDTAVVGAFDFSLISGSLFGFNSANSAYSAITFNSESGAVAIASSGAIVDTDTTNDGPPAFLGAEKLVGTFYVSPIDTTLSGDDVITITAKDQLVVTDVGNINPIATVAPPAVNTPPIANDDSTTATEDAGSITIDVLSNDVDAEGDAGIISATAANGVVVINDDGTITYTANSNFSGDDTITYTLADSEYTDTAIVTVAVAAVNDVTTVVNSTAIVDEDGATIIDLAGNATDIDGDALTITSASAVNGSIVDGVYSPNADFNGTDTITYTVNDSAAATVTVTVNAINDSPIVTDDTAKVHEDASMTINVLDNDSDVEGDTLTISSVAAANGTVSVNADGTLEYTGNTNFNGTDTITYVVSDGNGGTNTASVTVDVISVNDDPIANTDTATTNEDTATVISVLGNDTDADGDALGVASASAANGTVSINGDGTLNYIANQDFNGTDTITYTATDGVMNMAFSGGLFDMYDPTGVSAGGADDVTGTISINMATGQGTGAFSSNQLFFGLPWTAHTVTVQMTGLDTMTVDMLFDWGSSYNIEVTVPMSVVFNADGTATFEAVDGDGDGILGNAMTSGPFIGFTPAFSGTASFTAAAESVSTVTVDVVAVNDSPVANDDTSATDEDTTITIDVLANDVDVDGDTITITAVTATNGVVSVNADGTLAYTPKADFNGVDTITYTVTDGDTATVTVDVAAINDAPVANSDATTADESFTATIDVLGNDTDTEGDTLTVIDATAGFGTVTVNADSSLTYQGGVDYDGADTITYTVSDGNGGTATGTVQVSSDSVITVDNSGIINSTAAAAELAGYNPTSEVNLVKFDVFVDASVLAKFDNITGVNFSISTDQLVFIGSNDAITVFDDFENGNYMQFGFDIIADSDITTNTPAKVKIATFYADPITDASEISITLSNIEISMDSTTELLGNVVATLDANIAPEFDATSISSAEIVEDISSVSGTVSVSDINANDISYSGTSAGVYGSFSVNSATGTWTYTLDNTKTSVQALALDETVSETFEILSDDGFGGTDTLSVSVTVIGTNDAPIAINDSAVTGEDLSVTINILGNDTDIDGTTLTITTASAANGTVVVNGDGTVTYTGNQDFNGIDTISYTIADEIGAESSATVTVDVAEINDNPQAVLDFASTTEEGVVIINVLANDIDLDGDSLTVIVANSTKGATTINADGSITYVPNVDFNGVDTIFYTITDGEYTSSSTVLLNISAVNDAPEAINDTAATDEDTSVTIDVLANDTDLDGDALTVSSASATNGTVTINADNTVSYVGNQDFNGIDILTYTIADGDGLESTAQVAVTVTPTNDAPYAINDAATADEETLININVLENDSDLDGDSLTVISASALSGAVIIKPDSTIDYIGNTDFNGIDTITYTISDGNGGTAVAEVTVGVALVNDAPVAVNDAAVTHEDQAVTINVLVNDSDIDGDLLSLVSATALNGTVTINADDTLEYIGNQDFNGVDTITYTITDGNGTEATATVTVTTAETNDDPFANADTATTDEDTAVTIDVLANDTDTDGDTLVVTSASATNGTVTINTDGTLNYIANQDFNGTDTITYAISDGVLNMAFTGGLFEMFDPTGANIGGSDDVVGTMAINMATGQGTASFSSDQQFFGQDWYAHDITIQMTGTDTMTVSMLFDWGTNTNISVKVDMGVAFNADGTATFTTLDTDGDGILGYPMDNGPFVGFSAAFSGDADPVALDQAISTVTVDVVAINDAPVAKDDIAATDEDTLITINVLDNDYDVDGDFLTISAASATNGTVSVNVDGSLDYKGNSNFFGTDTITYTINDGNGTESTATVTVDVAPVNDTTIAVDDVAATNEDTAVTIDVLANDTDIDGDALSVASATANNGTVTINADGTLEYIGNQDFNGVDTITYVVSDGSVSEVMNLEFDNGLFEMLDDSGNVLGGSIVTGSLSVNTETGQGAVTFTSDIEFFGQPLFIHDSTIQMTGEDTLTLNMLFDWSGIHDIEIKVDMQMTDNGDGTATFITLDTDGDNISGYPISEIPFVGFSATFSGDAVFLESDIAEETIGTVTVDVAAINDGPIANSDTASVNEDAVVTIDALANDTDVENDALTITSASAVSGTVTINADGTLDYLGDLNFYGTDTITYTIDDGNGASATSTVTVDVASMGDGRVISDVNGNSLTNFTISLFDNGVDTGVVLEVDQGKLYLEDLANTVTFDTVVINADAFDFGNAITVDDIYALLSHKVGRDTLSGNELQAADVDNDNDVDGSDGWAMSGVVLKGLDLVNTFDMTDADGNLVTELSAAVDGAGLTLVANGDINQSGDFNADFIVSPDIV